MEFRFVMYLIRNMQILLVSDFNYISISSISKLNAEYNLIKNVTPD